MFLPLDKIMPRSISSSRSASSGQASTRPSYRSTRSTGSASSLRAGSVTSSRPSSTGSSARFTRPYISARTADTATSRSLAEESREAQTSMPQENGSSYGNGGYQDRYGRTPTSEENLIPLQGILEVADDGHGFLRPNFTPSDKDIYISASQIRRFALRPGDRIEGMGRPPKENERYHGLIRVSKINGIETEEALHRPHFGDLTAIYPNKQLKLETGKFPLTTRIIDLVVPIGKGQRGLIVSPPKAGKTTMMKDIASGISANFPDVHLMAVLVGERPEEVTDISRSVKGEVVSSNFDEPADNQVRAAEIALERAKRLVEMGNKDVVILLDSITRLARAYNLSVPPSGRTLSGGFDPAALYPPKRFFGAARNCEEGGSLTIIATALVDTGSRMDDLIYEEFKGTGNMELHLDRRLAERRVFPAIDVERSSTRAEELLFDETTYRSIVTMRRMLSVLNDDERTDLLLDRLSKTESNADFLSSLSKG